MITSEPRPFSAATSKLAYAQAFAHSDVRRRSGSPGTRFRLTRLLAALRRV